jgi:hypothetical protein
MSAVKNEIESLLNIYSMTSDHIEVKEETKVWGKSVHTIVVRSLPSLQK